MFARNPAPCAPICAALCFHSARRAARLAGVFHAANSATCFAYASRRLSKVVRRSTAIGWSASASGNGSHSGLLFFRTTNTSPMRGMPDTAAPLAGSTNASSSDSPQPCGRVVP